MLEGIGRSDQTRYGFCIIQLCHGRIGGRAFYAFVSIEPQNYPYFKKNYRAGIGTSFEAYGRELLRGWGEMPPQDIIDHVSAKHNVDFTLGGIEEEYLQREETETRETVTVSGSL